MLKNLAKAVVGIAVTPVDLVADICMLPASAAYGDEPFRRTAHRISQASGALDAALEPEQEGRRQ